MTFTKFSITALMALASLQASTASAAVARTVYPEIIPGPGAWRPLSLLYLHVLRYVEIRTIWIKSKDTCLTSLPGSSCSLIDERSDSLINQQVFRASLLSTWPQHNSTRKRSRLMVCHSLSSFHWATRRLTIIISSRSRAATHHEPHTQLWPRRSRIHRRQRHNHLLPLSSSCWRVPLLSYQRRAFYLLHIQLRARYRRHVYRRHWIELCVRPHCTYSIPMSDFNKVRI